MAVRRDRAFWLPRLAQGRTMRAHLALAVLLALAASGCATLVGPRNARRAGLVEAPAPAASEPAREPAPDEDLHPVILAYRESLRPFLGAEEQAALDEVDWAGTSGGDAERLRFLAADRAIRRVLPLLLEAEHDAVLDEHAARLRALPPLLSRDADVVQRLAVIEAMVALEQVRHGEPARGPSVLELALARTTSDASSEDASRERDAFEEALAALPRERAYTVEDAAGEAELAEALADYATEYSRAHGVSPLHGAAAAAAAGDMVDVAFLVGRALERGVAREQLVGEALAIADEMCGAARRRERLPRLHEHERETPDDDAPQPR